MKKHGEHHLSHRSNWLRASVLGANDGLISTASLMTGMVAAQPEFNTLLLTGISALVGGAISMAAGEYVSVSSQADTEKADMEMERRELALHPEEELKELTTIYQDRGLTPELAHEVAKQLTAHNALDAHMRDEISISEESFANPLQAAFSSAASFAIGAAIPILVILLLPLNTLLIALIISTLIGLGLLGYISAKLGGAPIRPAVMRILIWGVIAMGVTGIIGKLVGVTV
ncbi:VIT1/CCC1 transporter family protein [[Pasteurella] aerogenes]|nr:VIT family protein [[Pasteurella] aerogenes]MCI7719383.1 VIT family protein [[Pasteurella] aerogenes]MDY2796130.1 VIT family protein [[Pasteurella] aerogenes]